MDSPRRCVTKQPRTLQYFDQMFDLFIGNGTSTYTNSVRRLLLSPRILRDWQQATLHGLDTSRCVRPTCFFWEVFSCTWRRGTSWVQSFRQTMGIFQLCFSPNFNLHLPNAVFSAVRSVMIHARKCTRGSKALTSNIDAWLSLGVKTVLRAVFFCEISSLMRKSAEPECNMSNTYVQNGSSSSSSERYIDIPAMDPYLELQNIKPLFICPFTRLYHVGIPLRLTTIGNSVSCFERFISRETFDLSSPPARYARSPERSLESWAPHSWQQRAPRGRWTCFPQRLEIRDI